MTSTRRARTQSRQLSEIPASSVVVGQDVLELVTSAMYLEPLTVYREYIQNAADATDEAKALGILGADDLGCVAISLDHERRTVRIRDNGTGIAVDTAPKQLMAIGGSEKRSKSARGLRGVGRLAGLGYCRELVFRTRSPCDPEVIEIAWDGYHLKEALRRSEPDSDLAALVADIVTIDRYVSDEVPDRFFEVEMRGVVRHGNDALLNPEAVSSYLAEVAPVPFAPSFSFGERIREFLAVHEPLTELHIHINDNEDPVYRPHRDCFPISDVADDNVVDLDLLEFQGVEGNISAVAWILHHGYRGAIPVRAGIKGLRARMGNLQVGGTAPFEEAFPEARFNHWTVGEVHVLDRRIVPNGRRDHFEQNVHLKTLQNHLTPLGRSIARRCRKSSMRRNAIRALEHHRVETSERCQLLASGALSSVRTKFVLEAARGSLHKMDKILARNVLQRDEQLHWEEQLNELKALVSRRAEVRESSSNLHQIPKAKHTSYQEILDLIYECAPTTGAARALISRIIARIT